MRYLVLVLTVLAACSRAPRVPTPAPPVLARLTEGTAHYRLVEHRHVRQIYGGQPIVTDATTSLLLTTTLTRVDSGFLVDVELDSVTVLGDAALPAAAVRAASGTRLRGRIDSATSALLFQPPDTPDPVLDQVTLDLQGLLPALPPAGVTPGMEWSDSTAFHGRTADIPITIAARTTHHAGDWGAFDRAPVLVVTSETRYSLSGEGDRLGQSIAMRGTGVVRARRLMTPQGAIALGVRLDSLQVDVEVQASGIVIPVLQERVDTVRQVLQ